MEKKLRYLLVIVILWDTGKTTAKDLPLYGIKKEVDILLESAKDYLLKANGPIPEELFDSFTEYYRCNRRKNEFSTSILETAIKLISEAQIAYNSTVEDETEIPPEPEKPKDCLDVLHSGKTKSGVYTIWPRIRSELTVYCDMDTDGGGWTVIQRRGDFSTPYNYFYKDWQSYKNGFGNISEEFWIGNENIYDMTYGDPKVIRFDLQDYKGDTGYAQYETFWIDDEPRKYKLHIEAYSGNAGDSMGISNNYQFSTKDRDNDVWAGNCAQHFQGAWWYKDCTYANLNGLSIKGEQSSKAMYWSTWRSHNSLKSSEIKLRRK